MLWGICEFRENRRGVAGGGGGGSYYSYGRKWSAIYPSTEQHYDIQKVKNAM